MILLTGATTEGFTTQDRSASDGPPAHRSNKPHSGLATTRNSAPTPTAVNSDTTVARLNRLHISCDTPAYSDDTLTSAHTTRRLSTHSSAQFTGAQQQRHIGTAITGLPSARRTARHTSAGRSTARRIAAISHQQRQHCIQSATPAPSASLARPATNSSPPSAPTQPHPTSRPHSLDANGPSTGPPAAPDLAYLAIKGGTLAVGTGRQPTTPGHALASVAPKRS